MVVAEAAYMSRMQVRRVIVVVLSFLLLSLQSEALVHPIWHVATAAQLQEVTLTSTPAADPCVECSLLVGGFTAAPAASAAVALDTARGAAVCDSYCSPAGEVPSWSQSRAPPMLP